MGDVDITALLEESGNLVAAELESMPKITDASSFDPSDETSVPIEARNWIRVRDVVVVVADLKSSTQLGVGKRAASTASIYQAALVPVVTIFEKFDARHIEVQGDCVIGFFWGDGAVQRAVCSGITVKTFSERKLVSQLEAKWSDEGKLPATGFKVGIAMSDLLVKRVGKPRTSHWGLVWPGKAVNHASKAAQEADAHELIAGGSVVDAIAKNDYLMYSCGCGGYSRIWKDHTISKLSDDEPDRFGLKLRPVWCATHGKAFCDAILGGLTSRDDVPAATRNQLENLAASAIAARDRQLRQDRSHLSVARTGRS